MKRTTDRRLATALLPLAALVGACSSGDTPDAATGPGSPVPAARTENAPIPPNTAASDAEPAGTTTTPTTAPAAVTTTTGTPPVGDARCLSSDLELSLQSSDGAGGAGHQYRTIIFTNNGAQPCTLAGYPGVSFTDGTGAQVGPPAGRDDSVTGETVTLAPGTVASAVLDARSGELFGADECGDLVGSTSLRVYPPDSTVPISVPAQMRVCTKDVDQFRIRPVQGGGATQP